MKKIIRRIIIAALVVILLISGYKVGSWFLDMKQSEKDTQAVNDKVAEQTNGNEIFNRAAWNALYAENSDLVAYIHTANNEINLPVVRANESDDYYMRRNFDKAYSSMGIPFVDKEACVPGDLEEEDDNIMIYGHNVVYFQDQMFSPLNKLADQDEYDKCTGFTIWWKEDKVEYEITNVYRFDVNDYGTYNYQQKNFYDEAEFNEWIAEANTRNLVNTISKAAYNDQLVTLQTCVDDGSRYRLIVVGKEVSREKY